MVTINPDKLNYWELEIYKQFNPLLTGIGYTGTYEVPGVEPPYISYQKEFAGYTQKIQFQVEVNILSIEIARRPKEKNNLLITVATVAMAVIVAPLLLLIASLDKRRRISSIHLRKPNYFTVQQAAEMLAPNALSACIPTKENYPNTVAANKAFMKDYLMEIVNGNQWLKGLKRVPMSDFR